MAKIMVEILGDGRKLKAELQGVSSATSRAGSNLAKFGRTAAIAGAAAGAGIALGLKKSLDAAGDFQESLNVLQATTNATNATMTKASALAIKLGADVKLPAVSAKDAADAMLDLGRDGFTAMQSMAAARGTLLLVTAAQTDTATSAKVLTQTINAFGLKAKDTSKIVDQMGGFMNATGTDFATFADSLSYVSAPAHTVGQSFADTATQLAILSKRGIEGSMAGTGLRTMLSSLGNENSKASVAFKKLGVDTVDSTGKFIGMRAVIAKLHPALDKMTQSQKISFMQTAFGKQAMNQALDVLGITAKQYEQTRKAIERKGQADKLAASHMKGYNGAMKQLSSALETVQIQIGLKLLPVATRFVNWLTAELPAAIKLGGAAVAWIEGLYERNRVAIQNVIAVAVRFGRWLISEIPAAVKIAGQGIAWLGAQYDKHKVQIRAVIDAAKKAWAEYGPKVKEIANKIVADVKTLAADVVQVINLIRAHWDTIWSVLGPIAKAALQIVKTAVVAAVKTIQGVIDLFTDVLHGHWGKAWGDLKGIVKTALGAVVSIVGSVLRGLATSAWNLAKAVGREIVKGIKSAAAGLVGLAGDLGKKLIDALGQAAKTAYTWALKIGKQIAAGALKGVEGLPGKLLDAITPGGGGKRAPGGGAKASMTAGRSGGGGGGTGGGGLRADSVTRGTGDGQAYVLAWKNGITAAMVAAEPSVRGGAAKVSAGFLASVKATVDSRRSTLTTAFQALGDQVGRAFDAGTSRGLAGIQAKFDALRNASTSEGSAKTPAEAALASLTDAHDEAARQQAITDARASGDTQALNDALYAEQVANLQKQADTERAAADQATTDRNAAFDKQQTDAEVQYQAKRDLQKTHLDNMLTDLQAQLAKHPGEWKKINREITEWFKKTGNPDLQEAGQNLGLAFVTGLGETKDAVGKAAAGLAKEVKAYLKLNSPAEKGPLSDLNTWWTAMPKTLLSGIDAGALAGITGGIGAPAGIGASFGGPSGAGAAAAPTGGGAGGGVVIHAPVTVMGSVTSEQELGEKMRSHLIDVARRNPSIFGRYS